MSLASEFWCNTCSKKINESDIKNKISYIPVQRGLDKIENNKKVPFETYNRNCLKKCPYCGFTLKEKRNVSKSNNTFGHQGGTEGSDVQEQAP